MEPSKKKMWMKDKEDLETDEMLESLEEFDSSGYDEFIREYDDLADDLED